MHARDGIRHVIEDLRIAIAIYIPQVMYDVIFPFHIIDPRLIVEHAQLIETFHILSCGKNKGQKITCDNFVNDAALTNRKKTPPE
jgi:hypothetical protein